MNGSGLSSSGHRFYDPNEQEVRLKVLAVMTMRTVTPSLRDLVLLVPHGASTCGRDPKCSLCVPDETVSRMHCTFYLDESGLRITDLNSTHGCYVNGTKVPTANLEQGDIVKLGDVVLCVEIVSRVAGPKLGRSSIETSDLSLLSARERGQLRKEVEQVAAPGVGDKIMSFFKPNASGQTSYPPPGQGPAPGMPGVPGMPAHAAAPGPPPIMAGLPGMSSHFPHQHGPPPGAPPMPAPGSKFPSQMGGPPPAMTGGMQGVSGTGFNSTVGKFPTNYGGGTPILVPRDQPPSVPQGAEVPDQATPPGHQTSRWVNDFSRGGTDGLETPPAPAAAEPTGQEPEMSAMAKAYQSMKYQGVSMYKKKHPQRGR